MQPVPRGQDRHIDEAYDGIKALSEATARRPLGASSVALSHGTSARGIWKTGWVFWRASRLRRLVQVTASRHLDSLVAGSCADVEVNLAARILKSYTTW